MAQSLKDLAGRLPAGPRGMGTALKLLLGAGAAAYGIRESVFTGKCFQCSLGFYHLCHCYALLYLLCNNGSPLTAFVPLPQWRVAKGQYSSTVLVEFSRIQFFLRDCISGEELY